MRFERVSRAQAFPPLIRAPRREAARRPRPGSRLSGLRRSASAAAAPRRRQRPEPSPTRTRSDSRQAAELPVEGACAGEDVARRSAMDHSDVQRRIGRGEARIEGAILVFARKAADLADDVGRDGHRVGAEFRQGGMRLLPGHQRAQRRHALMESATSIIVGSPTMTAPGRGSSRPNHRMTSVEPRQVVSSS